jgi:hypothetical protein
MDLESLLTSPKGFGLVTATPLQRAIARAADGFPTKLPAQDLIRHFGKEPPLRPDLVVLICGVRSGKSLMAVCASFYQALTANLNKLLAHERARVVVVAPTVANAETTFRLLTGTINQSPMLKAVVVGEPSADKVTIRRQDGRLVDILVVAAHRGAVALRGTWLAGYILEETAFFGTDTTGYVVNAEELLRAAATRLVPKGQGWIISSPMGPTGLLYDLWRHHFGAPGKVVVVHAPTLAMNHVTVNSATIEEIRKRDPDAAAREYDALWADGDAALIPASHIDEAQRATDRIPPEPGQSYVAAMDPATRGNAWTLVVMTTSLTKPTQRVVWNQQWIGSKVKPLSPDAVLAEIALLLREYNLDRAATDQHSADANKDIARRHDLYLYDIASSQQENVELYTSMATKFADGEVELPPDPVLRGDLLGIRKRVTSRINITLAKTPDGRHCDYAPALARALSMGCPAPKPVLPKRGTPEWIEYVRKREKDDAMAAAATRARQENRHVNKQLRKRNWKVLDDN